MNAAALGSAIREHATALRNADQGRLTVGQAADCAELLVVLARLVEGMELRRAFGAPGDWGYETPIGAALAAIPEKGGR